MIEAVDILGVRVTSAEPGEISRFLDERLEKRLPTRIAFLNAQLSNICIGIPQLRDDLGSFLVLNDGAGVDLARRVLHGRAFAHNLNGTDFTPYFLSSSMHRLRIFLLGGRGEVCRDAAREIARRWPRHEVVGTKDGYFHVSAVEDVRAAVAAARPDIVLVAMGNPRQEAWIARNIPEVAPCALGVGAFFDFVTGSVPRAPAMVRRARLEWLFRLCLEPRRLWRRYVIGNARFVSRLLRERMHVSQIS